MPVQNYHPGESFRRYDLPVNVITIHFKNLLLRKIVTKYLHSVKDTGKTGKKAAND